MPIKSSFQYQVISEYFEDKLRDEGADEVKKRKWNWMIYSAMLQLNSLKEGFNPAASLSNSARYLGKINAFKIGIPLIT